MASNGSGSAGAGHRGIVAAMLSAALAAAQPASAQTGAGDLSTLPLEQLLQMEVQGASRIAGSALEAPSAVSVITREDIRTFGYRTLGDALASVRGVYLSRDRNYQYLGIRGFARPGDYNSRVLILVDGYALNDGIYNQAPNGHEFPLDMELVERIEFIPGAGSALYGSNAFFAVVNVVTRAAGDIGAQARVHAQSHGGNGVNVTFGRRYDSGLEVTLSATRDRSRGADLAFQDFQAVNDGRAQGLDFEHADKLYARISNGPFTLTAGRAARVKGIPTASFATAFNVPGTRTEDAYRFADIGYRWSVGARTELVARAGYHSYAYTGNYIYDVPPLTVNRDEARASGFSAEARLLHQLSERQRIVVGVERRHNRTLDQLNYDIDPETSYLDDRRKSVSTGLYVETDYRLRPDLSLNAGLRHDRHDGFPASNSPRLGLVYQPRAGEAFKLLYGKAFRVPNFYERFYSAPATQKANPGLEPEQITTQELVYERTRKQTRFSASLFRTSIASLIDQVVDPADGLQVFVNTGRVRARGVEAEAEHSFPGGLRLRGNLALQRAAGAVRLDNSPRVIAKLFASLPLRGDWLRAGLEALHVGQREGRGGVGGYTVLNLTAIARIGERLELRASIYNLGGKRYADPASDAFVQERIFQDGRTARIELRASY